MLNNTSNVVRYTITTPLASYSIPFPYWAKDEIVVYLTLSDGSISTLVEDTDYSVSTPNGNSGTLTRITGWTGSTKLTITREMPLKQLTDFRNGDVIDAETIEETFDQVVGQIQQQEEALSRAIKTPVDEAGSDITLPGRTARQGSGSGTILGFDSSGDVGVVRDLAQFDSEVSQVHSDATDAAASKAAAAASEAKAEKWAVEDEDVPVEPGKYSAKHYATKAITSANSAASSATSAGNSATSAGNSATAAGNSKTAAQSAQSAAESARDKAKEWANKDEDSPVETGKYSGKHYAAKAGASASSASTSATNASNSESKAKDWAEKNEDSPVETGKYSAKHYAAKAGASASAAASSQSSASSSSSNATTQALKSEGYAIGKQNGADVDASSPYYHNNAKHYCDLAASYLVDTVALSGAGPYEERTYCVGEYCIQANSLYRCITPVTTAEPFDSGKWRTVGVAELMEIIVNLKHALVSGRAEAEFILDSDGEGIVGSDGEYLISGEKTVSVIKNDINKYLKELGLVS